MKDRARNFQEPAPRRRMAPCRSTTAWAAFALLGAGVLAGCSLNVPMSGAMTDDTPTGSVKHADHPSPFSTQMDAEDWRRAKSAMTTALDPQGNGASVAWENPASGAKGAFVPLAQVYPKGDGICRPFAAHVTTKGDPESVMHATACRVNSGDWVVGQVAPAAPRASGPRKAAFLPGATRAPT